MNGLEPLTIFRFGQKANRAIELQMLSVVQMNEMEGPFAREQETEFHPYR